MELTYQDVQEILRIVEGTRVGSLELQLGSSTLSFVRGSAGDDAATAKPRTQAGSATDTSTGSLDQPSASAAAESSPVKHATAAPEGGRDGRESTSDQAAAGQVAVKAPLAGTFYRSPSPDAPPFVEVGDEVVKGDATCIVEVMKVMNRVPAPVDGTIVEVCAGNEELVEFGQAIFWIDPA